MPAAVEPAACLQTAVRDGIEAELTAALERGTARWPLPLPPLRDADFPVLPPRDAEHVIEVGLGLMRADPHGRERHLKDAVETMLPHRMALSDDPMEQNTRWLLRRVDRVVERILFGWCADWLSQALDPSAPDSDRWWVAIALLTGLSVRADGQQVHHGYHLIESIALAERPGHWHGAPSTGPHQIAWDPKAVAPREALTAHGDGGAAALWLMDRLEEGDEDRRRLLIEWQRLFLERPSLVDDLGVGRRIARLASGGSAELAARLTPGLPRLIEADREAALEILDGLVERDELPVRRALADVLTRLFRRLGDRVVPLLDRMLEDEDIDVLAAASSTVRDLGYLEAGLFADRLGRLVEHDCVVVRRNAAQHVRAYLEQSPDDPADVLVRLSLDSDEVVATRMREFLVRLEEVDPAAFSSVAGRIIQRDEHGLDATWRVLELRRPERLATWRAHLEDDGPMPERGFVDPVDELDVDRGFLDDNLDEEWEDDLELDSGGMDPLVALAANLSIHPASDEEA